jgi:hypothetical protein
MNITLPREQQEWLEAQVKAGGYESVEGAVTSILAGHMQWNFDDLELPSRWSRKLPSFESSTAAAISRAG